MTIKQLFGVDKIEVDKEEAELFIEKADGSGVCIDLDPHELMHLLYKYTDEEYGPDKIYGVEPIDDEHEDWSDDD